MRMLLLCHIGLERPVPLGSASAIPAMILENFLDPFRKAQLSTQYSDKVEIKKRHYILNQIKKNEQL
jgi:hypothetical protein